MHIPLQPVSQLAVILYKVNNYFMIPRIARKASDLEVTLGNSTSIAFTLVGRVVKGLSKM